MKGQTPLRTRDIHGLLLAVRESVAKTYSLRDPRAGLRLTDLLTRLGSLDLLEMFPKVMQFSIAPFPITNYPLTQPILPSPFPITNTPLKPSICQLLLTLSDIPFHYPLYHPLIFFLITPFCHPFPLALEKIYSCTRLTVTRSRGASSDVQNLASQ